MGSPSRPQPLDTSLAGLGISGTSNGSQATIECSNTDGLSGTTEHLNSTTGINGGSSVNGTSTVNGHSPANGHSMANGHLNDNSAKVLNVLITGGSSGIGRSLVLRFARAGHRVLFTFFSNTAGAREVISLCDGSNAESACPPSPLLSSAPKFSLDAAKSSVFTSQNGLVSAVFLDQGSHASISDLASHARSFFPSIDVLINNAALGSKTVQTYVRLNPPTEPLPLPYAHDLALLRVNTLGPIWLTSSLSTLFAEKARIIMIGSVGGNTSIFPEYRTSDLASKSALGYAARHLAARWMGPCDGGAWGPEGYSEIDGQSSESERPDGRNWTILTIAPGATETTMFRASNPTTLSNSTSTFPPRGRMIAPEEVADLVYYCATEKSAEILHGSVIDASLGLGSRAGVQTERVR